MALLTESELRRTWIGDKEKERRRFWGTAAATAAVFILCLCFKFNAYAFDDKFVPLEYLKSYILALRLAIARLADGEPMQRSDELIEALGSVTYYGALAQLRLALMSFAAGAGLSLSGVIFQTAYRNPMASPNIIGASAGVSLGNVVVVALYSAKAFENIMLRYKYCYGFTVVCVGLVMLLGKAVGKRRADGSVMEMVIAGSIVSQIIHVFTQYFMYNLPEGDLVLYQQISLGVYMQTDILNMSIFFCVMAASVLPTVILRYRLNALGLDRTEAASLGVADGALRVIAQTCGVLMATCSMIHYGVAGMVSLVIPCAMRWKIGSDFRQLSVCSILAGGMLLMACRVASSFIEIEGAPVPVSFAVELILLPAFAIILARRKGAANEA